ncbi:hypothetical protein JCM10213_001746 [Rhodosporidiobolus nylandii]
MLTVRIARENGNSATAAFPVRGQAGLQDVPLRGAVIIRADERASGLPPLVSEVWVRVIRTGSYGSGTREPPETICRSRLWSRTAETVERVPDGTPLPFELILPASLEGLSAAELGGSRPASVVWRLEAQALLVDDKPVDATPMPLKVQRHRLTPLFPSLHPSVDHEWSAPPDPARPLPFEYSIRIRNRAWAPSGELPLDVRFVLPPNSSFEIKSIKLNLRRRIESVKSRHTDEVTFPLRVASPSASPPSSAPSTPANSDYELTPPLPSPSPVIFPIKAKATEAVVVEGIVPVKTAPTKWAVGETGENSLFRVSFTLEGTIECAGKRLAISSVPLPSIPVHLVAAVARPELLSPRPSPVLRHPGANVDARSSSTYLSLPAPARPQAGRRMSEQSDAFITEPARNRVRREPPVPIALPPLSPSAALSPNSSFSSLGEPAVSRSSTVETLGPDTPSSMDFNLTAVAPSSRLPPILSSASYHPPSHHPAHSPRHGPRTSRTSRHSRDHRPRSAGSTRSSLHTFDESYRSASNHSLASLASIASGSSTLSAGDRRGTREMSAPLPSTGSPLLASSASGLVGLTLADGSSGRERSSSPFVESFQATSPPPPHYPSPSSPPSPKLPSPPEPHIALADSFRNPFGPPSPFSLSVVGPDGDIEGVQYSGKRPPASPASSAHFSPRAAASPVSSRSAPPSMVTTSPRSHALSLSGGSPKPPSPPLGFFSSKQSTVTFSTSTGGDPPAQQPRKGSIVGLLSRLGARRKSTAQ